MKAPSSKAITWLFAPAAGLCVANVYYAQPLLDAMAARFHLATAQVGSIVAATQLGSVLALVLLVPLGDLVARRRLLLWQVTALVAALLAVAVSASVPMLLLAMLGAGMLGTAMTQGLIAAAAAQSAPQDRGRAVAVVQCGVVIGLLAARSVAGILADALGWRAVYLVSAVAMAGVWLALWRWMPGVPVAPAVPGQARYWSLLRSMGSLLRHDHSLRSRGVLALLMFAAFNVFWSAMVLPLSAPPHAMSHSAIGAFGLIGVVGVLGAARAGHWVDRGRAQAASLMGLLLLLLAWLPLARGGSSLWALVLGILLLDLGGQVIHVTNQGLILRAAPVLHSRMVACYMLFYAVGSGAGALLATWTYAVGGWSLVCLAGALVSLVALLWWWASLRWLPLR